MIIRPMDGKGGEINQCAWLIASNWGAASAERFMDQAYEAYRVPHNKWAPKFHVGCIHPEGDGIIGVCAYQRSMKMHNLFHFCWVAVHEHYQGKGAGTLLTNFRLDEIRKEGGMTVELVTQKPDYFARFGFIKLYDLGGGWITMIKLLKPAGMD